MANTTQRNTAQIRKHLWYTMSKRLRVFAKKLSWTTKLHLWSSFKKKKNSFKKYRLREQISFEIFKHFCGWRLCNRQVTYSTLLMQKLILFSNVNCFIDFKTNKKTHCIASSRNGFLEAFTEIAWPFHFLMVIFVCV